MQRLGYQVRMVSAEECFTLCQDSPPDLMLGFNGAPQFTDGQFLCDVLELPYHALLVDPPYYYLSLLKSPWIKIYCDDACNLDFLEKLGYSQGRFLTQGVEPEIEVSDGPFEYEIVFHASFFDVERAKEEWRSYCSEELCAIMHRTVEATLLDDTLSLVDSFNHELQGRWELVQGKDAGNLYYMMSYVQKGEARNRLLTNIKHLPIHVWDNRWKNYLRDPSNITVHEAVGYEESLEIMKRAKIVLCNSIRSVRGCNERVLNALACGAVPFTNRNPYFLSNFEDGKNLMMYSPGDLPGVEEKIKYLLDNEEERKIVALAGRELVLSKHTWDARLREFFIE